MVFKQQRRARMMLMGTWEAKGGPIVVPVQKEGEECILVRYRSDCECVGETMRKRRITDMVLVWYVSYAARFMPVSMGKICWSRGECREGHFTVALWL